MLPILVALSLAILIPDVAWACSCVYGKTPIVDVPGTVQPPRSIDPPVSIDGTYVAGEPFSIPADWRGVIVTGSVVEIRRVPGTAMNAVKVQVWEGILHAETGTQITIYTNIDEGACGYRFVVGREYVIVTGYFDSPDELNLARAPRRSQVVNHCGVTRELDSPGGIQALEEIRQALERR